MPALRFRVKREIQGAVIGQEFGSSIGNGPGKHHGPVPCEPVWFGA